MNAAGFERGRRSESDEHADDFSVVICSAVGCGGLDTRGRSASWRRPVHRLREVHTASDRRGFIVLPSVRQELNCGPTREHLQAERRCAEPASFRMPMICPSHTVPASSVRHTDGAATRSGWMKSRAPGQKGDFNLPSRRRARGIYRLACRSAWRGIARSWFAPWRVQLRRSARRESRCGQNGTGG